MPIAVLVKSMKEAAWTSMFALSTTYVAGFIALIMSLWFYTSDEYLPAQQEYGFSTHLLDLESMAIGFSIFTFAFG